MQFSCHSCSLLLNSDGNKSMTWDKAALAWLTLGTDPRLQLPQEDTLWKSTAKHFQMQRTVSTALLKCGNESWRTPPMQRASALVQTEAVLVQLSKSHSTCSGNGVCTATVRSSYYGQQHSTQAGTVRSLLNHALHSKRKLPKIALGLHSKSCIT